MVAVGRSKTRFWREAQAEYLERLRVFLPVEAYELREERLPPPEAPAALHAAALRREGTRILAQLERLSPVWAVALDVQGHLEDSPALARRLAGWFESGVQTLALVVGGSDGLAPEVLERCQWRWSLSPLTFPHEVARILALEQIYRAFTLWRKLPYHR